MNRRHLISLTAITAILCGCAQLYRKPLNWNDLQQQAVVTFQDGTDNRNIIRIPVNVEWIAGDSLHVLDLSATYKNDVIEVTGEMRLPDETRPAPKEIVVYSDGSHSDVIPIVYKGPDGTTEVIQQVAIH